MFDAIAASDPPARVFAARARAFCTAPPQMPWDAVTVLETK
jgi:hypothetical protein